MKITNVLLIILICLVAIQKLPILKVEETVSKKETSSGITIGKQYTETKTIKATSEKGETNTQHSTSFSEYIDTNGSGTQRLSHNVRIGKDYYVSGGIFTRQSEYQNSAGVNFSVTRYW
jgi:hypothetical protein